MHQRDLGKNELIHFIFTYRMERQIDNTYYVPIILLGTRKALMNKTNKTPCFCELIFSWGEMDKEKET